MFIMLQAGSEFWAIALRDEFLLLRPYVNTFLIGYIALITTKNALRSKENAQRLLELTNRQRNGRTEDDGQKTEEPGPSDKNLP